MTWNSIQRALMGAAPEPSDLVSMSVQYEQKRSRNDCGVTVGERLGSITLGPGEVLPRGNFKHWASLKPLSMLRSGTSVGRNICRVMLMGVAERLHSTELHMIKEYSSSSPSIETKHGDTSSLS